MTLRMMLINNDLIINLIDINGFTCSLLVISASHPSLSKLYNELNFGLLLILKLYFLTRYICSLHNVTLCIHPTGF